MKILSTIIIFLILIAVVLEIGNVYLSNTQSLGSIHAGKLENEIADLTTKNDTLSTQVMEYSSLEMVSSRAAALGFADAKGSVSLFDPTQFALKK